MKWKCIVVVPYLKVMDSYYWYVLFSKMEQSLTSCMILKNEQNQHRKNIHRTTWLMFFTVIKMFFKWIKCHYKVTIRSKQWSVHQHRADEIILPEQMENKSRHKRSNNFFLCMMSHWDDVIIINLSLLLLLQTLWMLNSSLGFYYFLSALSLKREHHSSKTLDLSAAGRRLTAG